MRLTLTDGAAFTDGAEALRYVLARTGQGHALIGLGWTRRWTWRKLRYVDTVTVYMTEGVCG